jgi:fructosamine-3-kinase
MPRPPSEATVARRVKAALEIGVTDCVELDGGKVGRVHHCDLASGRTIVAKTGVTPLTVEARMLAYLDEHGLPVPGVQYASDALLCLEYVPGESTLTPAVERDVARRLAALHGRTAPEYGFPFDTLSGPYRQPSPRTDSWVTFFREHRLEQLGRAARDEGTLPREAFDRLEALWGDLGSLVPDDPPASLLHGDVWAENLRCRNGTVRAFLDPACSYGHAEVELAYADLVGFGEALFETYETERPIAEEFWEHRRDIYALYPLLEHVRYFDADRYREELYGTLARLGY